jgi:hypothetical protein
MFLSTRDPSVEFAADLNSRVTMVNFSVCCCNPRLLPLHIADSCSPDRSPERVFKLNLSLKSCELKDLKSTRNVPTCFVFKENSELDSSTSRRVSLPRSTSLRVTSLMMTSKLAFSIWTLKNLKLIPFEPSQSYRDSRNTQTRSFRSHSKGGRDGHDHGRGRRGYERIPATRSSE